MRTADCKAGAALPGALQARAPVRRAPCQSTPTPRQALAAHRGPPRLQAAAAGQEEDLWQYKDRDQWYLPKWAALDQPEWNAARFVRSVQLGPGIKEVTLEVEISRELVALRNAYKHVGQAAQVRVNGGATLALPPTTPPFSPTLIKASLLRVRGDMIAGEIKKAVDEGSVKAELSLLVREAAAAELYKAGEGDALEVGPFLGTGINLRGPAAAIFRYPTVVIFCEGDGIAAAKSLAEASPEVGGLSFKMRRDVRMYYRAPNAASLCYADQLESWGERWGVKVATSTRDTFSEMFDDDDTLVYEPETTAAVVLTGEGNEDGEAAAAEVCRDAEIEVVVLQSQGQEPTQYLRLGRGDKEYFGSSGGQ